MFSSIKSVVKKTRLAIPYIYLKSKFVRPHSQNGEAAVINSLVERFDIPKTFIELGFGGWEFNCAELAFDWPGFLLDGDEYNITIANTILPDKVRAEQLWLTLDTVGRASDYAKGKDIGILSIDVDGNDYWFLERLISIRPAMIICEYNATMGHRSITVPYDPQFDYTTFPTIFYSGASLAALSKLTASHGYSLMHVMDQGINAMFIRNDLLSATDGPLDPRTAWRDQIFECGLTAAERWETISEMPFVEV